MQSRNTTPEQKNEFLNQVANDYGFFQKTREIFIARFNEENAASKNTEVAKFLGMPHQEFQDYLGEICDKLGFRSSGKGRSRKGESPWEKAFTWLWNEKFVDAKKLEPPTANSEPEQKLLLHRQVCQGMLLEKRQLTTNPLTTWDGTTFERGDVYVPLGLVERRRQPKRTDDDSPEQGSKLYEPTEYEVTRRFEHDEFFEQVLRQGLSPKSRGKRIAIIGEPGAGKTTLLQQIADWVFEDTDQDVVIWVSLADLQGRTVEEYLLNVWLKDALKRARVTPEMEDSLVELFNRGRVWLLLDGVDEMTVGAAYGNAPLQAIAKQLTTGWVSSARVVLTCRLNVWDAGKNALERFDTYRTLEFSYGNGKKPDSDQINQFISKWLEPSDPLLGKALRTALDQRGKERIKDLVKNPLRLTLMCYSWQRRQGELPKTKATLYQRFVEAFYEWKQEYFPTTSRTRQELNEALGKLAVEAIAQSSSRFRLTRRFVCKVLGEPDAPLFQLAIQLGWLNQVGVAAEDPDEVVYAFYHPTFQEYFAALAIDHWHFFLSHVPHNPNSGIYRIFEPQWKEVFLLWLGRDDVPKQEKEEFINALVEFKSGWEKFYCYRAYFLAAAGIAEFRDYSRVDEIMDRLVKWSAERYWDEEKQEWVAAAYHEIAAVVMEVLKETERERASTAFIQVIQIALYECTRAEAALNLWQIDPGNEAALVEMVRNLALYDCSFEQERILKQLEQIDPDNERVIAALVELIETDNYIAVIWQAADILGEIKTGNVRAIAALVELVQTEDEQYHRRLMAESLGKVDPGNEIAIATLVEMIQLPEDESCRSQALLSIEMNNSTRGLIEGGVSSLDHEQNYQPEKKRYLLAARSLGQICKGNEKAITALTHLVQTAQDEYHRIQTLLRNSSEEPSSLDKWNLYSLQSCCIVAAESLGKADPGNKTAIAALVHLIETFEEDQNTWYTWSSWDAAESLGKIDPGNEIALAFLVERLPTYEEEDTHPQVTKIFEEIGTNNKTAITALIELIKTTEDEDTLWQAADILGKIDPTNETAIAALVELIETTEDEDRRLQAAESLGKSDPGNKTAIATLVELIQSGWMEAADILGKIDPGNETAIAALVEIIQTVEHNSLFAVLEELRQMEMVRGNKAVIAVLLELAETAQDKRILWDAVHHLRSIIQGTQFPKVVTVLKDYLKDENNYLPLFETFHGENREAKIYFPKDDELDDYQISCFCREAIWQCAQSMTYPDFYRAWHGEPSPV